MKRLLLTRHAKSSWDHPGLSDHERPLNTRGQTAAPRMGQELHSRDLIPNLLLTSTAVRAKTTAQLLAEAMHFHGHIEERDSFYGSTPQTILYAINELPESAQSAMLVGHNPTWEYLLTILTGKQVEKFPTCAIAVIDLDVAIWSQAAPLTGTLTELLLARYLR